jgi:hypothetical protein
MEIEKMSELQTNSGAKKMKQTMTQLKGWQQPSAAQIENAIQQGLVSQIPSSIRPVAGMLRRHDEEISQLKTEYIARIAALTIRTQRLDAEIEKLKKQQDRTLLERIRDFFKGGR